MRHAAPPPEIRVEGSTQISGDPSAVAPPVPIPNTAVKRCSPDGSTAIGRARVGRRQSKKPHRFYAGGVFSFLHYVLLEAWRGGTPFAIKGVAGESRARIDGQTREASG